ncbi:MAG TPA: ABC transporter ATP-binding protein [Dehalococcoidia bacterium]
MTQQPAITVRGLRKAYGGVVAVDGIDLQVEQGEVFALLGPNGAGKTTTIEILEGYRRRDAGEVRVLGHDPERNERAFKARIGIVLQTPSVERYLTVEEAVSLYRGYYPNPLPLDEVLAAVGLAEQRKQPVRRLSGGQQRRLDVAIGLAGNPDLLFLDEPTTGFDPAARRNAWDMVKNLRALGKTVLLTTHYLDEAQELADRVAILVRGSIIAEGTPAALMGRETPTTIRFRLPPDAPDLVQGLPTAGAATVQDGYASLATMEPTRTLYELTRRATERGLELEGLTVTRPSLEDVYLELTRGREDEEGTP